MTIMQVSIRSKGRLLHGKGMPSECTVNIRTDTQGVATEKGDRDTIIEQRSKGYPRFQVRGHQLDPKSAWALIEKRNIIDNVLCSPT